MKLRANQKKKKSEALCKNCGILKECMYLKNIPLLSVHKLPSHDIPPISPRKDKKKNRVVEDLSVASKPISTKVTEFERMLSVSNDNILPSNDDRPYTTRKRPRVNYLATLSNRKTSQETKVTVTKKVETEEKFEKERVKAVHKREEEECYKQQTDEQDREAQIEVIVENVIVNLRNIHLLNELDSSLLTISTVTLGEGQYGIVRLGTYNGISVACKSKRDFTSRERALLQAYRELEYAAKLSLCRYINRYIGWTYCTRFSARKQKMNSRKELYILQPYIENADARTYLSKRTKKIQPSEVLQASICLFSALTDAHTLNIGIVDLKLENFLIDTCGSGWLTDFGSCINIKEEPVDLNKEEVQWTRSVAAPEMLKHKRFLKASDVFMGTVIIAELMTADLNDDVFANEVLNRGKNYEVSFSPKKIDNGFKKFFKLLEFGLQTNPEDRPTAKTMLELLLNMK